MPKKILIVEDEPGILLSLKDELESEGYTVIEADNEEEGLALAEQKKPDLIILDIMLPILDGYEVCYQLRRKPETATLPIIMISGKAHQEDKDIGLKVGADDYLTKPVIPSALVAKVETLLTGTSQIIHDKP